MRHDRPRIVVTGCDHPAGLKNEFRNELTVREVCGSFEDAAEDAIAE